MNAIISKLKLDSHHKIERFGVIFLILLVGLLVTTVSAYIKVHNDNKVQMTNQVVYTTSFTTSLSGVTGSVENIYTNDDHTKTFMLLKFSDTSKISIDSQSYHMYLQGASLDRSTTPLNVKPKGSIYMFGNTGYMGLYLTDSRSFDNQILRLIVRGTGNITGNNASSNGTSFNKYDQFEIYFNPGGSASMKSEFLNSENSFTAYDIYEELVIRPREEELRKACADDLVQLKTDMDLISEYGSRVKADGVVIDGMIPEQIANDAITNFEGNHIANLTAKNVTANIQADTELYFYTEDVCLRGVDYDWRNSSIKEGIIDKLSNGMSPLAYMTALTKAEADESITDDFKIHDTWYLTSGEVFESNDLSTTSQRIRTDINNYTKAMSDYYKHKNTYQTQTLVDILKLELELIEAEDSFNINSNDDVVRFN